MPLQLILDREERQTELADVQTLDIVVRGRVRAVVPSLTSELPEFYSIDGFHLRILLMCYDRWYVHAFL